MIIMNRRMYEANEHHLIATSTLAIVGVALAVVAAGVGTYSAISNAQAQKEAADFNEKIATNNAASANIQAAEEARRIRQRNLHLLATQRVAGAKAGIDISSGSFQDVVYDSSIQGEMDALSALYTGKVSAGSDLMRAKLFKMEGDNAVTQGYFNAGSAILSGAGSAVSRFPTAKAA